MKIPYEMNNEEGQPGWLYTKCPHKIKPIQETTRNPNSKVGSQNCQKCRYFIKIDNKKQIVTCAYNETRNQLIENMQKAIVVLKDFNTNFNYEKLPHLISMLIVKESALLLEHTQLVKKYLLLDKEIPFDKIFTEYDILVSKVKENRNTSKTFIENYKVGEYNPKCIDAENLYTYHTILLNLYDPILPFFKITNRRVLNDKKN